MKPQNFTLPDLEARLDILTEGEPCKITDHDYERLFGADDVAFARLRYFANHHACAVSFSGKNIVFCKELRKPALRE